MQKGQVLIFLLLGIVILVGVIGGAFYFFKVKTPVQKACTTDAKICPDGTSVGRSGPNCEFIPCPSTKPAQDFEAVTIKQLITDRVKFDGKKVSVKGKFKDMSKKAIPMCVPSGNSKNPQIKEGYRIYPSTWAVSDVEGNVLGLDIIDQNGSHSSTLPNYKEDEEMELKGIVKATTVPDICRMDIRYKSIYLEVRVEDITRSSSSNEKYFVSFAKVNGEILLNYKGKIYSQEYDPKTANVKKVDLKNIEQYQWRELVESPIKSPEAQFIDDELFDFRIFPNKEDFIIIMRWEQTDIPYNVFYYNYLTKKVIGPLDFTPKNNKTRYYRVPKIDQISLDGEYVSFNMFSCWNCGGHQPETLLLKLGNMGTKRIGQVSLFNWKVKGAYEYKDYIVKECSEPSVGECSEDQENLPLKIGQY